MATESSNPPTQSEVITLGKKLVQELALADSVNTLGRWMAHYVAELIIKAEQAHSVEEKKAAERECYEVILKLWANRKDLPEHLQPLASLKPALSILAALHQEEFNEKDIFWGRTRYKQIDDPWGRFIRDMQEIFKNIFDVCLNSSLTQDLIDKEKSWLDEHANLLSEDEKDALQSLNIDLQFNRHIRNFQIYDPEEVSFRDKSPAERKLYILNSIESLIDGQKEKLSQLRSSLIDDD